MNLLPKLQLNSFSSVAMVFQEPYAHVICVLEFKFNINNRISENPSENKKAYLNRVVFVLCRCRVLLKCNVF